MTRTKRGQPPSTGGDGLVAQLTVVVNSGGVVALRLAAIAPTIPALLSLPCIHGETDLEKARSLVMACQAVCERLGGSMAGEEAALLLGLAAETKGELNSVIRRTAAAKFHAESDDFAFVDDANQASYRRRRQPGILEVFASELLSFCREKETANASGLPAIRYTDINWLDRYERYFGIWNSLYALRVDLLKALDLRLTDLSSPHRWDRYESFLRSSLFWWARYQRSLNNFVLVRGGAWILPDANDTHAIGDTLGHIEHASPIPQAETSWLARCVSRSPERSLDGFLTQLDNDDRGHWALRIWKEWLESCHCQQTGTQPCAVHEMITSCRKYVVTITESSFQVVEWYRELPMNPQGVDLATLSDRLLWLLDKAQSSTIDPLPE